ncbi:UNVERIFIED_CONTAM: hypothetical protein Sradi_0315100 [Sesamum radiatum]|uniref:Uncharacterized protein n=1 Tax=Sesamum radiatum TaxID=300843 RepID=A0AAW2W3B5_SESRA
MVYFPHDLFDWLLNLTMRFLLSGQWSRDWTVRGARWGSIGLPVEASSFSSHLSVLSPANWRLSAFDWRRHVPKHSKFYAVMGSLPTWRIR